MFISVLLKNSISVFLVLDLTEKNIGAKGIDEGGEPSFFFLSTVFDAARCQIFEKALKGIFGSVFLNSFENKFGVELQSG